MIYTILADGFEEIEALAVVDILRRAEIEIKTYSINDTCKVTGAHGIVVEADDTIQNIDDNFEYLFLPGGYPGYVNLENNTKLIQILKKSYSANKKIAAICAAPSIIGKLGFLNNKTACCFPGFESKLLGANVTFDDVSIDDNIITSRGAGTAHKLAFKLVEIIKDKATADKLSETMLY